jgi:hypothetical protein
MRTWILSVCIGIAATPLACTVTQAPPNPAPAAPPPASDADAGPDAPPVTTTDCPKPTAGPTKHNGFVGDETWTADTSPHILPYDTGIHGTLTIEPCAEVLIGAGKTLSVASNGKIVANGAPGKAIHIGATDKPFASIRASGGGTLHLSYVNVDGGGDPLGLTADLKGTFDLQGLDQTLPSQETLFVDHVTVAGSVSAGLVLRDGAGFANGSTDLTVTRSASWPVSIWARALDRLPSGNYTGNAHDEIMIPGNGSGATAVQEDTTMHDRGVPYRVGSSTTFGNLYVGRQNDGLATLTIEPGVTLRMKRGGMVQIQEFMGDTPARGAMIAVGTADKPIVFTSGEATPAPGDWLGIWYGLVPAPNNKIDHARIEYAGGASSTEGATCNLPPSGRQNDAAIRIFGPPSGQFVTNTTIVSSAVNGVDRSWAADDKPSFLPTNTFVSVPRCTETYPRDANSGCPTDPPCPTVQ